MRLCTITVVVMVAKRLGSILNVGNVVPVYFLYPLSTSVAQVCLWWEKLTYLLDTSYLNFRKDFC
jgi:hypothetical protein